MSDDKITSSAQPQGPIEPTGEEARPEESEADRKAREKVEELRLKVFVRDLVVYLDLEHVDAGIDLVRVPLCDGVQQVVEDLKREADVTPERAKRRQLVIAEAGDQGSRFHAGHEQRPGLLMLHAFKRIHVARLRQISQIALLASRKAVHANRVGQQPGQAHFERRWQRRARWRHGQRHALRWQERLRPT